MGPNDGATIGMRRLTQIDALQAPSSDVEQLWHCGMVDVEGPGDDSDTFASFQPPSPFGLLPGPRHSWATPHTWFFSAKPRRKDAPLANVGACTCGKLRRPFLWGAKFAAITGTWGGNEERPFVRYETGHRQWHKEWDAP